MSLLLLLLQYIFIAMLSSSWLYFPQSSLVNDTFVLHREYRSVGAGLERVDEQMMEEILPVDANFNK